MFTASTVIYLYLSAVEGTLCHIMTFSIIFPNYPFWSFKNQNKTKQKYTAASLTERTFGTIYQI